MATLDKHRGKGQQKVIVEYVNLEPGGQAIVGHVETGQTKGTAESSDAIEHAVNIPRLGTNLKARLRGNDQNK